MDAVLCDTLHGIQSCSSESATSAPALAAESAALDFLASSVTARPGRPRIQRELEIMISCCVTSGGSMSARSQQQSSWPWYAVPASVQVGCVRDSSGRALRATVSLQLVFQATKSWPTADAVILRAGGCHCASGSLGQSCKRDPIERSRTDDSDSVSVSTTAVGHAAT